MTLKQVVGNSLIGITVLTVLYLIQHAVPQPSKIVDMQIETASPYVQTKGSYPQFSYLPDSFNTAIRKAVQSAQKEHESVSKDNWDVRFETQSPTDNISTVPGTDERFLFSVESSIVRNDDQYVSVLLRVGGYSGGAHGYEQIQTFTFDRIKNDIVGIEDFYSTEALKELSSYVVDKLTTQLALASNSHKSDIDTDLIEEGAGPDTDNYSRFTINPDDTITFYFDPYQVAAYAFGEQSVTVDSPYK